jgi:hypothetical protein
MDYKRLPEPPFVVSSSYSHSSPLNRTITGPIDHLYPQDFPEESRTPIKLKAIRAARDFNEKGKSVRSGRELQTMLVACAMRPALAFARETIRLHWGADRIDAEMRDFVRSTLAWAGLPDDTDFEASVEWREYEDALLGLDIGEGSIPPIIEKHRGYRQNVQEFEDRDPCKWLDEWSVPGLSSEHRKKIKAQLLRAEGAFERSPEADPESAALACMRQAFDGIARVLVDAGILTEDFLRKEIPELVWDSAIAGGWWRRASETRQDIFPEQRGHYWVWCGDSRDSKELFRAETRDWEARLLEARRKMAAARASAPTVQESLQNQGNLPLTAASPSSEAASSALSEEDWDFTSEAQRIDAVAAYTKYPPCSQAALARTARVDPADLSKWKKGSLSSESDKKARIEKVLKNKEAPTPPFKRGRRP